jgi:hypothetical protein
MPTLSALSEEQANSTGRSSAGASALCSVQSREPFLGGLQAPKPKGILDPSETCTPRTFAGEGNYPELSFWTLRGHREGHRRGAAFPRLSRVTQGRVHDVRILNEILPEPGPFCVMDRGYIDFARRLILPRGSAFYITRAKQNLQFRRRSSTPSTGPQV